MTEPNIMEHLLANFADGVSWEEAEALSLTKHGALDVAEYFYGLGRTAGAAAEKERVTKNIKNLPPMLNYQRGRVAGNKMPGKLEETLGRKDVLASLETEKEIINENSSK